MDPKPDPNPDKPKKEIEPQDQPARRDHIEIHGDVGPGANVGSGSVQGDYFVGRDLTIDGAGAGNHNQFANLLTELSKLIEEAQTAGELDEKAAKDVLDSITAATDLVKKDDKPPKGKLIVKLQYVADVLDAAVDTFATEVGGVAKTLLKALPIVALLIKLASRIF